MGGVLFVNPSKNLGLSNDVIHHYRQPHIGLAYVAAYVRAKGEKTVVLDGDMKRVGLSQVARAYQELQPDVVAFTAATQQIHDANTVATWIRRHYPDVHLLVGGYHASSIPSQTLEEFPVFDAVVYGEGEETLWETIETLRGGGSLKEVKGIAYHDGTRIVLNPPRPNIRDLDALPYPAHDLFDLGACRPRYPYRRRMVQLPMCTTRGCPYSCKFCFRSTGRAYRVRSPEGVVDEIKRNVREFGMNDIFFTDETFTLHQDRVKAICEAIRREGLERKVKWFCETRVDAVSRELLKDMKAAGCRMVTYGVESGNQTILDKMQKGITLEQAEWAVAATKEAGMEAETNFMIGNPFETREAIEETINFVLKLNPHFTSFSILTPYPGTETAQLAEKGVGGLKILSRDWRDYGRHVGSCAELETVSRAELQALQRKGYSKFYLRPSRIRNLFRVVAPRDFIPYALHHLATSWQSRLSGNGHAAAGGSGKSERGAPPKPS